MRHEISCGAVVYTEIEGELEILLIRHKNGGHWAFPKGHVENDETEIQTAKREILEETGLTPFIDESFRHVVTYSPKKDVVKDVIYFAAKSSETKTTVQVEELFEARWLNEKKALKTITFDNDKKVLEAFLLYIKK